MLKNKFGFQLEARADRKPIFIYVRGTMELGLEKNTFDWLLQWFSLSNFGVLCYIHVSTPEPRLYPLKA